jgi:hypothetical protein
MRFSMRRALPGQFCGAVCRDEERFREVRTRPRRRTSLREESWPAKSWLLNEQGKAEFQTAAKSPLRGVSHHPYAFDVLVRRGEHMMKQSLSKRREILESTVKPHDMSARSTRHRGPLAAADGPAEAACASRWNRAKAAGESLVKVRTLMRTSQTVADRNLRAGLQSRDRG